jgi:hypothetical protein
MNLKLKYKIGQIVYLKTDPDQFGRLVVGYNLRYGHNLLVLAFAEDETAHYEFEVSEQKDILSTFELN